MTIPCSTCGHENDDNDIFCTSCGTNLSKTDSSDTLKTETPKKITIESSKSSVSKVDGNSTIRSPLWYELPLLFAIIGGLIAYYKIKNNDPKKARNCLILGVLLTIPLGLFIAFVISSGGGENPFYVISGSSMEPNLHIFDVITVQNNFPFNDLKLGDILVFNRPDGHDKVIVSRVAEILNKDPFVIRTKGDANPGSIPGTDFPITKGDYIGKMVYIIPQIGYVTRILSFPINYIIVAGILIIPIIQHIRYQKKSNL